jgi:rhodanese-related sulfurtransferase
MAKMTYRFGFLIILLALVLIGYPIQNSWSIDQKAYTNLSVDQFANMLDQKDFILINVHVPYAGEIPGTDILIPFNAIGQHSNKLPEDKDTKIVVYCVTGPMGYVAAEKLANIGYTRVFHFQGGMKAWQRVGKKLLIRSD